jgi:hypothetical protein
MKTTAPWGSPTALEWTLPDVLPGICRMFLRVPTTAQAGSLPAQAIFWRAIHLPGTDLALYTVRIALRTMGGPAAELEAIFLEEPRLDQMLALDAYAQGLAKHGLPALVAGRF